MLTYWAGVVTIAGMAAASAAVAEELWRERDRVWWTLLGRNQVAYDLDPIADALLTARTRDRA